ncbi:testican-2-like [Bolinopsis microptera]|uniref:testican-2-like n=1 Tax=Bolinopsis microptera TaxID=2820187 RepID=UPI003078DB1A
MYRVLSLLLIVVLGAIVQAQDEEPACESGADIRCRFVCSNRGDKCLCGTDGMSYRNTCEMRCNAQRYKRKIFKDHNGPCMEDCTAEDFDGFKYRFVEWFDMIEKEDSPSDYKRVADLDHQGVLMVMFRSLDTTDDMVLEWGELKKVAENPYEHCVSEFYRLCDTDKNQLLSIGEWGECFEIHIRLMPCDRLRAKAAKARGKGASNYHPSCSKEGYCLPVQCREQFCWCTSPACKTEKRSLGRKSDDFTCDNY